MRRSDRAATVPAVPMDTFQSLLAKKLSDALARAGLPELGELTQATDPRFGDYQSNVALVLGKQRGENPRSLAPALSTSHCVRPPSKNRRSRCCKMTVSASLKQNHHDASSLILDRPMW